MIEPSSISRRIIKGGTEKSRGVRSRGRLRSALDDYLTRAVLGHDYLTLT